MRLRRCGHLLPILLSAWFLGACSGDQGPAASPLPDASATRSTITSSSYSLPADGISTATITVTLRTSSGAALKTSAGVVKLHATAGALGAVTDNADGTYTAIDTATIRTGVDTVTGTLDGIELASSVAISLVALAPASGVWFNPRTWVLADGVSSILVEMFVQDEHQNPVTDPLAVSFRTSAGRLSDQGSSGDGYFWATLTSSTADETAMVTAQHAESQVGPGLSVRFDRERHWTARAPLLAPRMSMGIAAADGVLYSIGGNGWEGSWLSTLDVYDPVTNGWTTKAAMPTARTDLSAAAVGSTIYAIGGFNTINLDVVEAYDPSTNTWSTRTPMPTARSGLAIGVVNGILYAVGGRTVSPGTSYPGAPQGARGPAAGALRIAMDILPSNGAVNTFEAYDPSTDQWTVLPPMRSPRAHLGVGVIDGILYAVGGSDGLTLSSAVEAFDPATGRWSTRSPMPTPRRLLAVAALGGKLYAIGGLYGYFFGTDLVQVYDPATDTWTTSASMLVGRMAEGAVPLNGLLYTLGGQCDYEGLSSVEAFTP